MFLANRHHITVRNFITFALRIVKPFIVGSKKGFLFYYASKVYSIPKMRARVGSLSIIPLVNIRCFLKWKRSRFFVRSNHVLVFCLKRQ